MTSSTVTTSEMVDYYQRLNLQIDWSCDEIRKALRQTFSDTKARVISATGEKKQEINLRMKWITSARKILVDPDARAQYDKDLQSWYKTATPEQKEAAGAIPSIKELWALIDAGRYLEAVQAGKRLVTQQPENDRAWEVYARANYRASNIDDAIYAAGQALACAPDNAEYFADAGQYLSTAERWDEAKDQLHKAIDLAPTNIGYKFTLCNIYMEHKEWNDAEAVLEGVLSQHPDHETAQSFMAIVISERAEERLPEIVLLAEEGERKQARKLLKEVKEEFEKAQQLAEHDADLRELINSESIAIRRALGVNAYMRLLGLLIDALLLVPGVLLVALVSGRSELGGIIALLLMWGSLGYSWIYLAYKNNGQDLTKRLLGMQIVNDTENSVPAVARLTFRALLKPVTLYGILFVFALMVIGGVFQELIYETGGVAFVMMIFSIFALIIKVAWDMFFLSDKDLAPRAAFLLFLHDHLTKTTVACSTKDDAQNFGEYIWY